MLGPLELKIILTDPPCDGKLLNKFKLLKFKTGSVGVIKFLILTKPSASNINLTISLTARLIQAARGLDRITGTVLGTRTVVQAWQITAAG